MLGAFLGERFWWEESQSPSLDVRNRAWENQEVVTYLLTAAFGLMVGFVSCLLLPSKTASVARKVWIFPVSVLVFALIWALLSFHFNWTVAVSEVLVTLPWSPQAAEPPFGILVYSNPAAASFLYTVGWRLCQKM